MAYLVVSDLHYRLRQLDWVAERAGDFDAVIVAGDLLDAAGGADLNAQISLWLAYLERLTDRTEVVVCSGNHDLTRRRPDGEKGARWFDELDPAITRDGQSVVVGSDLLTACGWWEGPRGRAELEAQLEATASSPERDGRRWIWAHHAPPDASPTAWSGTRHFGDELLEELITTHRPDVVLTGHVHEAPFRPDGSWHDRIGSTLVLNAGRQHGDIPTHLVVDTTEADVMWWSLAGREVLPLAGPPSGRP